MADKNTQKTQEDALISDEHIAQIVRDVSKTLLVTVVLLGVLFVIWVYGI